MKKHNMPFDVVEPSELEEVKPFLDQVLRSLNAKDAAIDLREGKVPDLFYKVAPLPKYPPPPTHPPTPTPTHPHT
jgi:hypothetical protein